MMMKDKLERFVRDNREDFDVFEPRADLWKDLEKELGHEESQKWLGSSRLSGPRRFIWQIAASVLLVLGLGGYWYYTHQYAGMQQPEVATVSPAYTKQFTKYVELIEDKRTELKTLTESNPALYQQFAADLDRLEKSYQNLKSELPKTPNQEVLIQAMVQNLQTQIDLLNQQLMIIQRIKQQNYGSKKELV